MEESVANLIAMPLISTLVKYDRLQVVYSPFYIAGERFAYITLPTPYRGVLMQIRTDEKVTPRYPSPRKQPVQSQTRNRKKLRDRELLLM